MGLFELLVVLFVVFLVIGPRRLTNLFRALGRGVRDFGTEFGRHGKSELPEEEQDEDGGSGEGPERRG